MFVLAVSLSVAAAAAFYPALALGRARRLGLLVIWLMVILPTPLLVAPDHRFPRLLAAIMAIAMSVKLYDLHVGASQGHRPELKSFLINLPNMLVVVLRRLDFEPRPGRLENLRRLAWSTAVGFAGWLLATASFQVDWRRWPFALEHCTKVLTVFACLVPSAIALTAIWRLLGGRGRDPMDNPFAAWSPADFWRRYNRPAQQFFQEDVFKRLGGRRRPLRAALGTFAISGVIHEYLFAIAIGRLHGYQLVFFLLQGVAAVATSGRRPRGKRAVAAVLGTLGFNLATSVLFFASLNEVVPFYVRRGSRG